MHGREQDDAERVRQAAVQRAEDAMLEMVGPGAEAQQGRRDEHSGGERRLPDVAEAAFAVRDAGARRCSTSGASSVVLSLRRVAGLSLPFPLSAA